MRTSCFSRPTRIATAAAMAVLAFSSAQAATICADRECSSVAEGEVRVGDYYNFNASVDISGTHEGDLIAFAQSLTVSGLLTGDLAAFGQSIVLSGEVRDSVRVFANTLAVSGTIDGDLLVFAQNVVLAPGARVTGDVLGFAQSMTISGDVEGDVASTGQSVAIRGRVGGDFETTAGEVILAGTIGRTAKIRCDTLETHDGAWIEGNLSCTAREPSSLDGSGLVGGEVVFSRKRADEGDESDERGLTAGDVGFRLGLWTASFLVGVVFIAAFRRVVPAIVGTVSRDALPSLGVGFVLAIVLPVGAVLSMFLVVTLPLAIMVLMLWLIALYVAKLPVAIWLGRAILQRLGKTDPSPYLGLPVGLVLLYVGFALPYLGWVVYIASLLLGVGAIVLGVRVHVRPTEPSTGTVP